MANLDRDEVNHKAGRVARLINAFLKVTVIASVGFGAVILLGYVDVRVDKVQDNLARDNAMLTAQIAEIRASSTTAQLTLNRLLLAETSRANESAVQLQALTVAIEGYVTWKQMTEQVFARLDLRISELELKLGIRNLPLELPDIQERPQPPIVPTPTP